jgi:nucleoside-diphosphate-sugar epimerase
MRVLLTGATGFIGSYALRRLLAAGHQVAVLVRPGSNPWRIADVLDRARRVEGDLDRIAAIERPVRDFAPEAVAHLAWFGVGNRLRNDPGQVDNIKATVELVRLADKAGAKQWVGLGSQAEYGPRAEPIDEQAPTRPTTLYGISKLSACLLAGHLCGEAGMRFAWLRVFSTYGPKDDPGWMIPYLILELLRGNRPALTAGEQMWDYLYIEDAAEAVARAVGSPGASGVFNLGSGRGEPLRAIIERARDRIDPSLPLGFGEVPYRPDQVMRLEARIDRLRAATGWGPQIGLDEGLRRTVDWFREHRRRYEA